jgi:hypothetical protein
MLCLASDKITRVLYLKWLKETYKDLPRFLKAHGVDFKKSLHYPPGFFAPGGFLSANLAAYADAYCIHHLIRKPQSFKKIQNQSLPMEWCIFSLRNQLKILKIYLTS